MLMAETGSYLSLQRWSKRAFIDIRVRLLLQIAFFYRLSIGCHGEIIVREHVQPRPR